MIHAKGYVAFNHRIFSRFSGQMNCLGFRRENILRNARLTSKTLPNAALEN